MRALRGLTTLRVLALSYLLFALVVTVASRDAVIGRLVPDFVLNLFAPNDRENLEPDRVLHFLLLAFVFVRLVPSDWSGLRWKLLQPVIKCGEEWLATFCAGVFLSFAGHLVLITGPNSLAMQILVSAGRARCDDGGRLLRVVVETAGPQVGAGRARAERAASNPTGLPSVKATGCAASAAIEFAA